MAYLQKTFSKQGTALVGQLADASAGENIHPMYSGEATIKLPFGSAVKHVPASATPFAAQTGREANQLVKAPTAITENIFGIILHSHSNAYGDVVTLTAGAMFPNAAPFLTMDALVPGTNFNVLRQGRVYVKPESSSGVVPGARLFVRAVAGNSYEPGSLRGSADGIKTIDCTNQGYWLTAPNAEGFAELEVDFVSKGGI